VRLVELPEGSDPEQHAISAGAKQGDGRIHQAVDVQRMHVAGWRDLARKGQVPLQQRSHVIGSGIVDTDDAVHDFPYYRNRACNVPAVAREHDFGLVCEVEPATTPDLMRVRHQIGVMSKIASAFLIPDNHIGRATVSSIAVAHEVALMGGRSIACLNARDRNLLGFRRDLLTAAAYGVDEFLFVYGDRPESGTRSDDLTVRSMISEARRFARGDNSNAKPFRVGVTTGLRALPAWKREADFLFVQALPRGHQPTRIAVLATSSVARGRSADGGHATRYVVKNQSEDVRNIPVSVVTSVAAITGIDHFGSRVARSANSFVAIAP